jgi:hypothetical protein
LSPWVFGDESPDYFAGRGFRIFKLLPPRPKKILFVFVYYCSTYYVFCSLDEFTTLIHVNKHGTLSRYSRNSRYSRLPSDQVDKVHTHTKCTHSTRYVSDRRTHDVFLRKAAARMDATVADRVCELCGDASASCLLAWPRRVWCG